MFMVFPQALMEAHDCIAEQESDVETIEDVDQDLKTTKLVSLEKTRDMPLVRDIHLHSLTFIVYKGNNECVCVCIFLYIYYILYIFAY